MTASDIGEQGIMNTKETRERILFGSGDNGQKPRRERRQKREDERPEQKSAGKIVRNIFLGFFGVCLFLVLGFYIAGMVYFHDKFFMNTRINGVDVSQMTVEEVEERISAQIGAYRLEIQERGGKTESITASEIDYQYVSQGEVQAFKKSQKIYTWPVYIWESIAYTFDSSARYDEAKLKEAINNLECLDEEKSVAPADAYIDYLEGRYQVVPEVEGNLLDRTKVERLIVESVDFGNVKLSLEEKNCYQIPAKRQNDQILTATCEKLNKYVSTDLVYLFGSNTETLNGDTIRGWLSYDDQGNVEMDQEAVRQYVAQLAEKYDTADRPREFVTHSGSRVTVEGGSYGWLMDQETEIAQLTEAIENGTQGERYAAYAQTAVSWENSDLGDSYVEIDLTGQHVWLYINGEEIVSTDCVSGNMAYSDRVTPSGTYTLYYKESPSVLKGENNEYESKVTYWMPFNGGIGLHDATWRTSFGGNIYLTDGSHGCINLPLEAAKQIYENVYDGIPIICYY